MTEQRVKLVVENNLAIVTLNRAERHNALDMLMFVALDEVIKQIKSNKEIRVVIVTGEGDDFCSGLDIKSVLKSKSAGLKLLFKWLPGSSNLAQRVTTGWRKIPVPVIFAVQGRCWGGGLQLALGGDFRIATPDSSWAIMEGKWGLIPDMGGTLKFRELMRLDIVMELAMTAKKINGVDAQLAGLVTHISEQPYEAALKLAEEFCERSPDAIAAVKKLYQRSWWSSARKALFRESYYQIKILLGKNQKIAVRREQNREGDKCDYLPRKF